MSKIHLVFNCPENRKKAIKDFFKKTIYFIMISEDNKIKIVVNENKEKGVLR